MRASIFGRQSNVVWFWAGAGLITLIDHSIAEINFGVFGALAAWAFVLPIILLMMAAILDIFGL